MKGWIGLLIIAILALAGCSQAQSAGTPISPAADAGVVSSEPVTEIQMTARQWQFTPDTVTVNRGDKVRLLITSIDVNHGIAIPALGINALLRPGQETAVEFTASQSGVFPFFCSVQCGAGHGSMRGTIFVN